MRRIALTLLFGAIIAISSSLSAATMQHFSLKQLSEKATLVVRVKVLSSAASWNTQRTKIWTRYGLSVEEKIKGDFDGVAACYTRGGVVGRKGQRVAGAAQLVKDQEYMLFLWKDKADRYRLLGMKQGAFKITRPAQGEASAKNAYKGISFVNDQGKARAEKVSPISMTLTKLIAAIKAALPQNNNQGGDE